MGEGAGRLSVTALVADAYVTVSGSLPQLFRLGRGPFVVAMVLGLIFGAMRPDGSAPLALLATVVAYAWFSFCVVRLALLGPERTLLPRATDRDGEGPLIPRSGLGTYMGRALGLAVLFGLGTGFMLLVVVVPLSAASPEAPLAGAEPARYAVANLILAALLAALPFGVPVARLLPALVATALERDMGLASAWSLSRGHGLRLTIALLLLLLPYALGYAALHATQVMLAGLSDGDPGLIASLPALALSTAMSLTATALAAVAMARASLVMAGSDEPPVMPTDR